ncbi:MAG: signal recognition particle-docking protein FtsY, partial [Actinomycetes bacterium]
IVTSLRADLVARGVRTPEQARAILRDVLIAALRPELNRSVRALPHEDGPAVVLVAGVNGTGKTTTTGKLARVLVADGRRVLLGAADTFRAAAADQLETWGRRVGAEVVRGKEGADPAAVAFDAVKRGIAAGVDAVLIDTAGRLHTKTGLMDELGKVKRVVEKQAKVDEVLTAALSTDAHRAVRALPHQVDGQKQPAVVLIAGVNGTGKTTTTGKLARVLVAQGSTVVLGAADTFRAAAAEQLQTWGERVGATVVRGKEGADPAAVAFDAVKRGIEDGVDAVLVDTAGRLHTKTGLMDELGKVKRVVEKQAKVDEVLLVLDATTGQNGLAQARVFAEVVDVTGIVLTKLDGTAKGGIVFQVQRELGVPVKLVGLGEGPDDLAPFEPGAFVDALLG